MNLSFSLKNAFTKIAIAITLFISISAKAQLPYCPDTLIYYVSGAFIYKYAPNTPISATNPSTYIPSGGAIGISLNNNLNGGPSPTFYGVIGGNYSYWNGSTWIPTGHSTGTSVAVNPGGGGCYIYNLVGGTGDVYRYDGSGPGTLLTTITGFSGGGPYDLASDVDGNFYVLRTTTPQYLNMYDFTGFLLISYTMSGMPSVAAGAGFVIDGSTVYVLNGSGFYKGVLSGFNINFTLVAPNSAFPGAGDLANCPTLNTGVTSHGFSNTGPWSCNSNTVALQAAGWPLSTTYAWSGPGIVGATSNSMAVANTTGMYNCTVTAPGNCPTVLTTIVSYTNQQLVINVTPPTPTVCLGAGVNLTAGNATNYTWTPSGTLSSGTGSMVTASPTVNTTYTISATSGTCVSAPKFVTVNVIVCTTGINENKESIATVNLFPNPSTGDLTVKSNLEMNLNISDELGRVVRTVRLNSDNNFEVSVNGLNNGFYFISDKKSGKSLNAKIVIIN